MSRSSRLYFAARFNHRSLRGKMSMVRPIEFKQDHYRHNTAPAPVEAALTSLH